MRACQILPLGPDSCSSTISVIVSLQWVFLCSKSLVTSFPYGPRELWLCKESKRE